LPNTSEAPRLDPREPGIEFHHVWKKFRRGEVHDSLRDLVPAMAKRLAGRAPRRDELGKSDFWALRDVDFTIGPGEALGIIGPNGAGKSTALKLLTRILRPTRGWCEVRGRVGALIEIAAGFHPDLTGRENVFLQGAIIGMPSAYIARRFDEIVEFSGIAPFIDTPVKRYSSGMNARLGFAIAAHLDPQVLVIDEVLAVGDMGFQQKCYDRLAEFRRAGIPIAFVSHNMQAVASVCDRGMLLRPGQEPLHGSVTEIIAGYTAGAKSAADARVTGCAATLVHARDGRPVLEPIAPHDELVLQLRVDAAVALPRCQLSLQVTRADGVEVYDGVATPRGAPHVDVPAGGALECAVRFRPNLVRGTYLVGVTLLEAERHWKNLRIPGLATFVVDERQSWSGFAAMDADVRLAVAPAAPPVGLQAALT
jgi:lipopolysaccharide transport system ATP-binding protein